MSWKNKPRSRSKRPVVEALESRILLSADLPGFDLLVADPNDSSASEVEQLIKATIAGNAERDISANKDPSIDQDDTTAVAATDPATKRHEVIFIDPAVPEFQQLVDALQTNTSAETQWSVLVLDTERNGLEQIRQGLGEQSEVDAVHILSHGSAGAIQLGGSEIDAQSLEAHASLLAGWAGALTPDADLLIYGCDLASTDDGERFISTLAQLTGADVAASDDLTGHVNHGGDWELEYRVGEIESAVAISSQSRAAYQHTLANITGTAGDDVLLGGVGDDLVSGAGGNDALVSGGGSDQLNGDAGADVFRFTGAWNGDVVTVDGGTESDTIDLTEFGSGTVTDDGSTITADLGGGTSFTINYTNIESVITADTAGNHGPDANAGPDQPHVMVNVGVDLDGSRSDDFDGDTLTYSWSQISGPAVTLSDPNIAKPSFTSPNVAAPATLTFSLTVSDGATKHVDTVDVTVLPTVQGTPLDDNLNGTSGDEFFLGLTGNDTFDGGAGDDVLAGGMGDDVMTGGTGIDIAYYSDSVGGVTVDITVTGAQNTGGAGTDTLSGIEGVIGSLNSDTFVFSNPQNGAVYTVDGNTGSNTIDVSGFASSAATFGDSTMTIDMGGGQSFTIDYTRIDSITFSDLSATVLSADMTQAGFSGTGIWIDGAEAFKVDMSGGGTVNIAYEKGSDTFSVTGATSVGAGSALAITDLNGTDLRVDQIVIDATFGSLTTNTGVGSISLAGSSDLTGTFTIGGDVGSILVGQDLSGSLAITGDVGTLQIDDDISGSVDVGGNVTTFDLTGIEAGNGNIDPTATVALHGDVGNLHVHQDIGGSVTVDGTVTTLTLDDDITGTLVVGGDVTTFDMTGTTQGSGDIVAGATVTFGGNVGTMHVHRDVDAPVNITGSVGSMTIDRDVTADITIGGDLDSASMLTVGATTTINAGQVVGALVFNVGGTDHGGTYAETVEYIFHGATQSASVIDHIVEVTTTSDANDAGIVDGNLSHDIDWLEANQGADGKISLREAITAANNTSGSDNINFDISGTGPHLISLGSALPTIEETLIINGWSEPDFASDPVIRIDGASGSGLVLASSADNSIIRGLMITNFTQNGIDLQSGADGVTIQGNWIGTSGTGSTGVGNSNNGIQLQGSNATIGGTDANGGNIITNNGNEGINIVGSGVTGHVIQGNIIGLDPDGSTGSGNTDVGIAIISGSGNTIGGTSQHARNVISNNFEGIEINTDDNIVQGNYIGTDAGGTLDRGNRSDDGVEIQGGANGNLIGGVVDGADNLIAFNNLAGVNIFSGTDNAVLGNRIYSNGGLGINLDTGGVTGNDPNDTDGGANNKQNFPVLDYALTDGRGHLTVKGSLDTDQLNQDYRIELFTTSVDEVNGEAERFLTAITVKTDGSGDANFSATLPALVAVNEYVTVTATVDNGGGDFGNTSEFAANVQAAPMNSVLWISTDEDIGSPGADGLTNGWTQGEVLQLGGPDLNLGAATDGDFSRVIDFDCFTAGATDVGALHFVSQGLTIGSGLNTFDLQVGDVLVSFNQDEDILGTYYETGVQTTIHMNDLLAFRPDKIGDYTSGTFYMLLNGVPDPLGTPINSLHAISLVEQDTTVGGTVLSAGTFLFAEQSGAVPNTPNHIYHFAPTVAGQAAASGTSQILIDGDDIDIEVGKNIRGLELIERPTTVGGLALDQGDILVTLSVNDASVGDGPIPLNTMANDVFVLKVTQAEPEPGNLTAATAEMVLDGSLVDLDGSERPYAMALLPDSFAPTDLKTMATSPAGGLSLNENGGDDAYLIADDGGALLGGLSQVTLEFSFAISTPPPSTVGLFSYAEGVHDEELGLFLTNTGQIAFSAQADTSPVIFSAGSYPQLLDGERHHVAVSWDSSTGAVEIYVDGDYKESFTGYQTGLPLDGGGTLILGNDQDSIDADYDPGQAFNGVFYEVRVFNDVRSRGEIAAHYQSTLPHDESGLIANWVFTDLSTNGVTTDAVSGNNLTVKHINEVGFTAGNATLTLRVDEDAVDTTVVGTLYGTDADRDALIAALLAADSDLSYSAETGKFYKTVNNLGNWTFAWVDAQSQMLSGIAGQLATVRSAAENELVHQLAQGLGTDVWLGGSDQGANEGDWFWFEGGAAADQFWSGDFSGSNANGAYYKWFAGQPDDSGSGAGDDWLRLSVTDGTWSDNDAGGGIAYVAEWDADEVLDTAAALTYSIQSQTVVGAFAIDGDSGEITVADASLLNFDNQPIHTLNIRVTDAEGHIYDEAFTVALNNVDKTPLHLNVPGAQSMDEDTTLTFSTGNGNVIAVGDDAGETPFVTVSVTNGTLSVSGAGSATVGGNGTATVTLSGTVADINLALDGLQYDPTNDWNGSETLTISTVDGEIHTLNIDVNLEGYYAFESGAPAADGSPAGTHNGTMIGDASVVNDPVRGDVLNLDGAGDSVRITGLMGEPSHVTLAAWINMDAGSGNSDVISIGDFVAIRADNPGGGLNAFFYDGTSWHNIASNVFLAGTGWHHVAYTFDDTNNTQTLYLDGIVVASDTRTESIGYSGTGADTHIGQHGWHASRYFDGKIDDARVYSRALSAVEIAAFVAAPEQSVAVDTVAIIVDPVNDTPTLSATAQNDTLTENTDTTSEPLFGSVTIDPIEVGDDIASAQLTLGVGIEDTDTLTINGTAISGLGSDSSGALVGGHSYAYTQASGVLTISFGVGTNAAAAEAVLASITYGIDAADHDPSTTARTVTLNTVTDNGGGADTNTDINQTATISLGAVDDALTGTASGNTVGFTENGAATAALFSGASIDTVEAGDTITSITFNLTGFIDGADQLFFNGTPVAITASNVVVAGGFTYTVAADVSTVTVTHAGASDTAVNTLIDNMTFDSSSDDPGASRTVNLGAIDDTGTAGTLNPNVDATITISASDDALTGTASGNTVGFTENGAATAALFSGASIDTVEAGDTITSITFNLTGFIDGADQLFFNGTPVAITASNVVVAGGFTYTVAADVSTVTVTHAGASDTAVNTLIDNMTFDSSSDDPGASRTVNLGAIDDTGTAGTLNPNVDATITISASDDALTGTASGNTVGFTENGAATAALFSGASIDTVEAGDTITSITFNLTGFIDGADQLFFNGTPVAITASNVVVAGGFTYTVAADVSTVTVTHAGASDTAVNTLIDNMTFDSSSDDPGASRTVNLGAIDDTGTAGTLNPNVDATITISASDDALTGTASGNTVGFTENGAATAALFSGASIDTVEAGDTITSITFNLTGFIDGADQLFFNGTPVAITASNVVVAGGFTYTVAADVSTVTVTHAGASDTAVNTLIDNMTFDSSSDDPGASRTVNLGAIDDTGTAGTLNPNVDATITISASDDALTGTASGNTVGFTENGAATAALFSGASIDTVEAGDTITSITFNLTGFIDGADQLFFNGTPVAITASNVVVAGGFTYTVAADVSTVTVTHAGASDTAVNTLIDNMTFDSSSDDPGASRTVNLGAIDDTGTAGTLNPNVDATITISASDDALTGTASGNTVGFTENGAATAALFSGASIDTVEAGDTITSITFNLTGFIDGADQLFFNGTPVAITASNVVVAGGFTYTVAADVSTVTVTHAGASDTAVNTLIDNMTFDSSSDDPGASRTVNLGAIDDTGTAGTLNPNVDATITISASDDALTGTASGNTVGFTENGAATAALFSGASIDTVEAGDTITSITFNLTGFIDGADQLFFNGTPVAITASNVVVAGGFTYTVAADVSTVTVTHAGASDTAVNTLIDNMTFDSSSDDPGASRTVNLGAIDDTGTAGTLNPNVDATITISASDDALTGTASGNTVGFTENGAATAALFSGASIDTVEAGDTITSITFNLTGFIDGADQLFFNGTPVAITASNVVVAGGFTYTVAADVSTVTVTHAGASDTAVNTLIDNMTFDSSSDDPGASRTVNLGAIDDTGTAGTLNPNVDATITISASDDALTGTASGNTVGFTENGAATAALFSGASIDTVEAGDTITSITFNLTGFIDGADQLFFNGTPVAITASNVVVAGGFTYTVAADVSTVTVTHAGASDTAVNTLIDNMTFDSSSDDPGASRTVNLGAIDDTGTAGTLNPNVDATITISASDDALTGTASGNTVGFTENGAATAALFSGASIDTVEAGDTITSITFNLTGFIDGADQLFFNGTPVAITASNVVVAGGFTYTVAADVSTVTVTHAGASDTAVNTLIDNMTFDSSSDDPGASRTVNLGAIDDTGTAGTLNPNVDATITISASDDALTGTASGNTVGFTENGAATAALFSGASIDTVEAGDTITSITFNLTGFIDGADQLFFNGTPVAITASNVVVAGGFTYTVAADVSTVTVTHAGASDTAVNTLIDNMTFDSSSDDPGASRTVNLGAIDDTGTAGTLNPNVDATITISALNDTPTLVATAQNDTLTENTDTTSAPVFSSVTIDPIETGDSITSAQLTLSGGLEDADIVTVNGTTITNLATSSATGASLGGGHTYDYDHTSGVLTISFAGGTNAAAAEAILEGMTYGIDPADNDPSTTARTVTLNTVSDSSGGSDTSPDISETATINVGAVNDDPLAANDTGAVDEDATLNVTAVNGVLDLNDSDEEGHPLSVSAIRTGPEAGSGTAGSVDGTTTGTYGTLTLNSDGSYSYVADQAAADALAVWATADDTFTYTVSDGNGGTDTAELVITVIGTNDDPTVANPIANQTATENAAFSFTFAANTFADADSSDTLTYTATLADNSALPSWLSFNGATRTFSGTPTNADVGTLSIKVTADDGTSSVVELFDITVNNVNNAPVIGGDGTGALTEDVDPDLDGFLETSGTLTIADPDAGESSFQVTTVAGAYGSLSIDAAGNWRYLADNIQAAIQQLGVGDTLVDVLTVSTADGTTHDIAINLQGTDDAPLIGGSSTGSVAEDGTLTATGTLTITDVDTGDNPIGFPDEAVTLGDNGYGDFELIGSAWTYTLNNAHAAVQSLDIGESLTDAHTFTASDGSTQVVVVTIHGDEDAPVVSGTVTGSLNEGDIGDAPAATAGSLSISDVDTADSPTFAAVGPTAGANGYGRFELTGGTWSYTLNQSTVQDLDAGDTVTDSHTFVASDGTTQPLTVTITGTDDQPVVSGTTSGVVQPNSPTSGPAPISGMLAIADVDQDDAPVFVDVPLTLGAQGYGYFALSSGIWTYIPDAAAIGVLEPGEQRTDSMLFAATDGTTQLVTVTLAGANLVVAPDEGVERPDVEAEAAPSPNPKTDPAPPEPVSAAGVSADSGENAAPAIEATIESPGIVDLGEPVAFDPLDLVELNDRVRNDRDDSVAPETVVDKPGTKTSHGLLEGLELSWNALIDTGELTLNEHRSHGERFWQNLDQMGDELDEEAEKQTRKVRLAAEAVAGVTLTLTAGFVSWVLRAGSLMVSFLTAMPLWRQVDPTPILAMDSEESSQSVEESNDDEEKQVEDDAFEDLFAK